MQCYAPHVITGSARHTRELNQRRVCVSHTLDMRQDITLNSQWIAFLLSPTVNLDGKRGVSGEGNVSSSIEPRKLPRKRHQRLAEIS